MDIKLIGENRWKEWCECDRNYFIDKWGSTVDESAIQGVRTSEF